MSDTLATKLIRDHLEDGEPTPGSPIALRIDQTLTQDATGTLVMLALEALGLEQARTEISAQYVDHNLIQEDAKNPDDHVFLESACARFGLWFARPGTGVSHPVHMQQFGRPGASLLGSDSHTCAAGALGMLAMGAGGLDVALAIAGQPYRLQMPEIWGIELVGSLPAWVSAKDVVLELLRRHGVAGGVGRVIEYFGPGVAELSAWDRHVIANMGAELGATTSVFPSDDVTRRFLARQGREEAWQPLAADDSASYDHQEKLDLGALEPLIAKPSSPGNVVPVRAVEGTPIYQAYLGSSANPGFRDFAVAASIVKGRRVADGVSFDVNPTTRALLLDLSRTGLLADLVAAGARLHQAGCNGCIGMGQAPATGRNSVRTVPRNFPGRSGTAEDAVWLASPETTAASALAGALQDPRKLGDAPTPVPEPQRDVDTHLLLAPPPADLDRPLVKGPNVGDMPTLDPMPETLSVPVLLTVGDDISTDEIMPAGAKVLPFRSNVPKIAQFTFEPIDPAYVERTSAERSPHGHAVVGGRNYGQGSSREHAALAPRYLGLRLVLAPSFSRIHRQNLINYGVLPLRVPEAARPEAGARLHVRDVHGQLRAGEQVQVDVEGAEPISATHDLTAQDVDAILAGGVINLHRERRSAAP